MDTANSPPTALVAPRPVRARRHQKSIISLEHFGSSSSSAHPAVTSIHAGGSDSTVPTEITTGLQHLDIAGPSKSSTDISGPSKPSTDNKDHAQSEHETDSLHQRSVSTGSEFGDEIPFPSVSKPANPPSKSSSHTSLHCYRRQHRRSTATRSPGVAPRSRKSSLLLQSWDYQPVRLSGPDMVGETDVSLLMPAPGQSLPSARDETAPLLQRRAASNTSLSLSSLGLPGPGGGAASSSGCGASLQFQPMPIYSPANEAVSELFQIMRNSGSGLGAAGAPSSRTHSRNHSQSHSQSHSRSHSRAGSSSNTGPSFASSGANPKSPSPLDYPGQYQYYPYPTGSNAFGKGGDENLQSIDEHISDGGGPSQQQCWHHIHTPSSSSLKSTSSRRRSSLVWPGVPGTVNPSPSTSSSTHSLASLSTNVGYPLTRQRTDSNSASSTPFAASFNPNWIPPPSPVSRSSMNNPITRNDAFKRELGANNSHSGSAGNSLPEVSVYDYSSDNMGGMESAAVTSMEYVVHRHPFGLFTAAGSRFAGAGLGFSDDMAVPDRGSMALFSPSLMPPFSGPAGLPGEKNLEDMDVDLEMSGVETGLCELR